MRGIACGTTPAKRACWRRLPSGASKSRYKVWIRSAARFLLDGFKRCRSAKKLGIDCVPYVSLGEEEATGILNLMRVSTDKGLGILEQARFVVDLVSIHGMNVAEVAQTLSRSKGWVSMRRRLLDEMSPADPGDSLPRGVSRVLLHVHLAAVHAHEHGPPAGDRAVCAGRGRLGG